MQLHEMKRSTADTVALDPARQPLAVQIENLLARLHPTVPQERRRDGRIAAPVLFVMTPLDADLNPIDSQAVTVVGKNISRRGISFFHDTPLPQRRAIIELAHAEAGTFAAEIDIRWCRFTEQGWYESGGRLIRSLAPRGEERL
jgi:hypothetical protein